MNNNEEFPVRVKYSKRIIGKCKNRDEAVQLCETYARKIRPAVVNPSMLTNSSATFVIERLQDGKISTSEVYTVILAMRR